MVAARRSDPLPPPGVPKSRARTAQVIIRAAIGGDGMTQRTIYTVTATRTGEWWALEVPEVPGMVSRARRLDQAEAAAREAIALLLDVPADSFGIALEPELEGPSGELLHVARLARERAERAQEEARAKTIAAVQTFAGQGMTVRDIGRLIGVSHQQAAKLLRRGEPAGSLSEAGSSR